jgi:hypothetical protein
MSESPSETPVPNCPAAVEQTWKAGIVVVVAAGNRWPQQVGGHKRLRHHHGSCQ